MADCLWDYSRFVPIALPPRGVLTLGVVAARLIVVVERADLVAPRLVAADLKPPYTHKQSVKIDPDCMCAIQAGA